MAPRFRGRPAGVSEEPDDRQVPRLQDTTERDALPLPLPDEPAPVEDPTAVHEPAPVQQPAAEASDPDPARPDPEPDPEPGLEPPPEPVEEPSPEPAPVTDPPAVAAAAADGGGHDAGLPPFEPSPSVAGLARPEEGPRLELLVGAAFVGGLALAILIKRLGN